MALLCTSYLKAHHFKSTETLLYSQLCLYLDKLMVLGFLIHHDVTLSFFYFTLEILFQGYWSRVKCYLLDVAELLNRSG